MVGGPGRYLTSALEYHFSTLGTVILASAEGPLARSGRQCTILRKPQKKENKVYFAGLSHNIIDQQGAGVMVCVSLTLANGQSNVLFLLLGRFRG